MSHVKGKEYINLHNTKLTIQLCTHYVHIMINSNTSNQAIKDYVICILNQPRYSTAFNCLSDPAIYKNKYRHDFKIKQTYTIITKVLS